MRQKLASALGIKPSERRAVSPFYHELTDQSFDQRIAYKKLRNDLDVAGVGFPMFRNYASQERLRDKQDSGSRGCAGFPLCLQGRGTEIYRAGIAPAFDRSPAYLAANTMPTRDV